MRPPPSRPPALSLESLEARCVPAAIRITSTPAYGDPEGTLRGVVTEVDPAQYSQLGVAAYIQIEGLGWFTKPTFANPTVPISADGTFAVDVTTGGSDPLAGVFCVALVPAGTTPPRAEAAGRVPDALAPLAIDFVERYGRTILFAGHTWGVKESQVGVPVGPGPNPFSARPEDVFVDESGRLHLTLRPRDGVWQSTEVILIGRAGYGTYSFQTDTDTSNLDPKVTFAGYTFDRYGDDESGAHPFREIDFEDSRFGDPNRPTNAQAVVQPFETLGNLHRYTIPTPDGDPTLTRAFTWTPEQVEFVALRGRHDPAAFPPESLIDQFVYSHDPSVGHFVPTEGRSNFRFNLWLNSGATAPDNGQPVEVVISAFSGPVPDSVDRPRPLSVGGSAGGTARVYAPSDGRYANPPTATTPSTVFPGFGGEVRTATGDFDADGVDDTVLVTGPGVKTVMAVVSGADGRILLQPSDPFGDANFTFGGFVTAGDIDRDGRAEWVVTPELRGGPRVIMFRLTAPGTTQLVANFFGIQDPSFRDGARAAVGDATGDGIQDVFVIAAFNGGPRAALYDGRIVLAPPDPTKDPPPLVGNFFVALGGRDEGRGGRSIAAGDIDGDGRADLIATGDNMLGTGNQIVVFSGADLIGSRFPGFGATPIANFTVGGQSPAALVSVAAVDADGNGRADLAVGSGAGQSSLVRVYRGTDLTGTTEPASTSFDPFGAVTLNGVFVG